jgi:hypothetical protein
MILGFDGALYARRSGEVPLSLWRPCGKYDLVASALPDWLASYCCLGWTCLARLLPTTTLQTRETLKKQFKRLDCQFRALKRLNV